MKEEVQGLVRGGHETRAEEFLEKEPAGEDEPEVDLVPEGTLHGGTPSGMTEDDVEMRTEIARFLKPSSFPAVREVLLSDAIGMNAPAAIVDRLRLLPSGREFANVNDVTSALGIGVEAHRF